MCEDRNISIAKFPLVGTISERNIGGGKLFMLLCQWLFLKTRTYNHYLVLLTKKSSLEATLHLVPFSLKKKCNLFRPGTRTFQKPVGGLIYKKTECVMNDNCKSINFFLKNFKGGIHFLLFEKKIII